MDFAWDSAKSQRNLAERGFGFDAAALIFDGPVIEWCDVRHTWGEARIVAVGVVEKNVSFIDATVKYMINIHTSTMNTCSLEMGQQITSHGRQCSTNIWVS